MATKEIDFRLIEDKPSSKLFKFENSDGTPYDMTGSSAVFELYLTSVSTNITPIINVTNGTITVVFTPTHSDNAGIFEYRLVETRNDASIVYLIKGNITVESYIPFSESLEAYLNSELPANLTLTQDYRNQKIMYWRRFLQSAFYIADININKEASWPTLVNALIAKLVVHDALMLAARGSYIAFFGGDYTSSDDLGGPIKKIETGPANVEFHSASAAIGDIFGKNSTDSAPFDYFNQGLCGLANKLGVKIPMCTAVNIPISPTIERNADWAYPTLAEWYNESISQG